MENTDNIKKMLKATAIMHICEAMIAFHAAKKRGKNPKKYFLLTMFLGVFVLVPLLRKPKEEKE